MNDALEIQGQVRTSPRTQVQNKGRGFRLRGTGLCKTNLIYSNVILEEKPPKYVTFVASEEKKMP